METEGKKQHEVPPVPQPEIQQVPSSYEQEPPPVTPEDIDRFEKERRRKLWDQEPPMA